MKKLAAISILLTLLTAAAFAQFKVGVVADFYPDVLKVTAPTGDAADKDDAKYAGTGTFDFMSSANTWKGSELRVNLSYKSSDGNYEGKLQLKGDKWFYNLAKQDSNYDDDAVGASGFGQADDEQSVLGFLNVPFGDWYVKGTAGILTGYLGNVADRGKVARFHDTVFNNFLDTVKMDNYGIVGPANYIDVNNVAKYPSFTADRDWGNPYMSVTANLAPISVTLAGDLSHVAGDLGGTFTPSTSYNKVGLAARVSGEKIADMINLDAIYKLEGGDIKTEDKIASQPDGEGLWGHTFGLFANVDIVENLGIGVGYSGSVRAREKSSTGGTDTTYAFPYYNGIDLRFQFTGVDKLAITFNNNVSFAVVNGDDNTTTSIYTTGYLGSAFGTVISSDLVKDQSEAYLGLYNAIGAKFSISDSLYATGEVANQLRSATYTYKNDTYDVKAEKSKNTLRAFLGAGYAFDSHVLFESGLIFQFVNEIEKTSGATKVGATADVDRDWGNFTFGIPLRLKIEF